MDRLLLLKTNFQLK